MANNYIWHNSSNTALPIQKLLVEYAYWGGDFFEFFWYLLYYPHTLRDAVSPVCSILSFQTKLWTKATYCQGLVHIEHIYRVNWLPSKYVSSLKSSHMNKEWSHSGKFNVLHNAYWIPNPQCTSYQPSYTFCAWLLTRTAEIVRYEAS